MLNTLHAENDVGPDRKGLSRLRLFFAATAISCLWVFLPGTTAPHMINQLLGSDAKPNRVSFYGVFIFLIHLLDLAELVLCLPIFPDFNADLTLIL